MVVVLSGHPINKVALVVETMANHDQKIMVQVVKVGPKQQPVSLANLVLEVAVFMLTMVVVAPVVVAGTAVVV